jgi:hypothetical protein
MARDHLRFNRFGFAEYADMLEISQTVDAEEPVRILRSVVALDDSWWYALSGDAQADFAVPLGSVAALNDGDYSTMEVGSAACTVR